MSPSTISINQKKITTALGVFHRAMETKDFIYFVNYEESDENGSVKMYSKLSLELVSDNYHGFNDMMSVALEKRFTWMSQRLQEEMKNYLKEDDIDDEPILL